MKTKPAIHQINKKLNEKYILEALQTPPDASRSSLAVADFATNTTKYWGQPHCELKQAHPCFSTGTSEYARRKFSREMSKKPETFDTFLRLLSRPV
jgi:hypothetical protein